MALPPASCKDCIKGVPNADYLIGDTVSWDLFNPDDIDEPKGWMGTSINWMLDDEALDHLLQQRKRDNTLQFKAGAVRISRDVLDGIVHRYGPVFFGYEIRPENDNRYHGHLLFNNTIDKRQKTTICGALSYAVNHYYKHMK